MCGIFGFIGKSSPDVDRLRLIARLAGTRGPHTWGQAWLDHGLLSCRRYEGNLDPARVVSAKVLIGHARLATSGDLSLGNAQPISSPEIAIAHNGNIYNHQAIFDLYGYSPKTANDSEAILAILLRSSPGEILELVDPRSPLAVLAIVRGTLVAVRRGHPLWVGRFREGNYFCSRKFPQAEEFPDTDFHVFEVMDE